MQGAIIESLESRRLFNAVIAADLGGTLPQTLLPASSDHLTLELSNTGDSRATGAAKVGIYISAASSAGDPGILIGHASRRLQLTPGRSEQFNVKFKLPQTLADGQYVFAATVSTTRAQAGNGSMVQTVPDPDPVVVQASAGSLTGSFVGAPLNVGLDTAGNDGTGTVSLRVTNVTASTIHGNVSATIYLSSNTNLDSTDQFVGVVSRRITLGPGESKVIKGDITIPASTDFGKYHLLGVLGNYTTGIPTSPPFDTQPITVSQGVDDLNDNTSSTDTGDDSGSDDSGETTTQPTTQSDDRGDDGATSQPTTQPTTDPGSDDGGSDDSSGDDGSGVSGGIDDSGDDTGIDSGSSDDSGIYYC